MFFFLGGEGGRTNLELDEEKSLDDVRTRLGGCLMGAVPKTGSWLVSSGSGSFVMGGRTGGFWEKNQPWNWRLVGGLRKKVCVMDGRE